MPLDAPRPTACRRALAAAAAAGLALVVGVAASHAAPDPRTIQHGIGAVFERRSYAPGADARLDLWTRLPWVRVAIVRAGAERVRTRRRDTIDGVVVRRPLLVRDPGRVLRVPVGRGWASGLYAARLTGPGGLVGFAPFVLRPARLGESRVAVVLPTNTWQAYNFLDVDYDGVGDTWYASPDVHTVDLLRPFADFGVPPHFGAYDSGFLWWLAHSGHRPDVLSDDDLEAVASGDELARLYDLIVFPGHEEYVTPHVFDVVERYRDLGGNLAFLSANDFYYRVTREGHVLHGRVHWRDLGRPEAALIGVQYVDWNQDRYPNGPYVVVGRERAPWLFRGTGLENGDRFGAYGIEIDARAAASPPGVRVLARIPDLFGPGESAEMTYYETPRGAKVFAAGTINFGGTAAFPVSGRMIANLWRRLSRP
jgi:hypothetical protein